MKSGGGKGSEKGRIEQIHTRPQRIEKLSHLWLEGHVAVLNSFNKEGSVASLNTPQAQQQLTALAGKSLRL